MHKEVDGIENYVCENLKNLQFCNKPFLQFHKNSQEKCISLFALPVSRLENHFLCKAIKFLRFIFWTKKGKVTQSKS